MIFKTSEFPIILASQSARRAQLLTLADIPHSVVPSHIDESVFIPEPIEQHPRILAEKKADKIAETSNPNSIIIAADTSVFLKGEVLNKPEDFDDAVVLLKKLSDRAHDVITGVCIRDTTDKVSFDVRTTVVMDQLSMDEIMYYIEEYKPYDKAGAYGIQDWIGVVKVKYIQGSYTNIVGLPMEAVYSHLLAFAKAKQDT